MKERLRVATLALSAGVLLSGGVLSGVALPTPAYAEPATVVESEAPKVELEESAEPTAEPTEPTEPTEPSATPAPTPSAEVPDAGPTDADADADEPKQPTPRAFAAADDDAPIGIQAFSCVSGAPGLLFQGAPTSINNIDLVTGANTVTPNIHPTNINAVGYHLGDDHIYGIDFTTQDLVRVDQDGAVTSLGKPTALPANGGTIIGDVAPGGQYWVAHNGVQRWYRIDLSNPGAATYGQVVAQGPLTNPPGYVGGADWAHVPGQGNYLFRPATNTTTGAGALLRFNMATGVQEVWGEYPGVTLGGSGAVYASPGGYLYASMNATGQIWRIDVREQTAVLFASGPASSANDGARCATSNIWLDLGDAPDSYGTLLDSDGPRHSLVDYVQVGVGEGTAQLMIGAAVEQEPDGVPDVNANGDGGDDGVADPIVLVPGQSTTVPVTVTNNSGAAATLVGWIDLNNDGVFGNGAERVVVPVSAAGGVSSHDLTFPAAGNFTGNTYARFRVFPGTVANPLPTGPAANGEVEDYVVRKPALAVTKTSDASAATRIGDVVTYTVTLTNTGTAAYPAASPAIVEDDLSDVLDDATWLGTLTPGSATFSDSTVRWSGPLNANQSVTIRYSVRVTARGDQVLRNVAHTCLPGAACAPVPPAECVGGISATTGLPCAAVETPLPLLEIDKSASRLTSARVGDTVTYQIVVRNTGRAPFTALAPARFVDDLSGVLDDADWLDDVTATAGTTAYADPKLSWTGPLAVGASATITYRVRLTGTGDDEIDNIVFEAPACADGTLDCPVPPTPVSCPADGIDPITGLAVDCVSVDKPRLDIEKTSPELATARSGDTVTYRITARNVGSGDYTAANPAEIVDDLSGVLDDGTYAGDATASRGSAPAFSAPQLTWSGALPAGESVLIEYTVVLDRTGDRTVTNIAFQPACALGAPGCAPTPPDCVDGVDATTGLPCDSLEALLPSSEITKTAPDLATARAGQDVTYRVTLTNTGPGDYTTARPARLVDDLTEVLDDATYNGDATATRGATPTYAAPQLSWSGPLAAGQSVTLEYTVTLTGRGDHTITNIAFEPGCTPGTVGCTPTPPTTCVDGADPATGLACDSVTAEKPHLVLDKSAAGLVRAKVGDTVVYQIVATNDGTAPFTAADPARFVDDLSGVLDDAVWLDATASAGAAAFAAPHLSWSGPIGVGESVTITYRVRLTGSGDDQVANVVFEAYPCAGGGVDCPIPPTPVCSASGSTPAGLAVDCVLEAKPRMLVEKTSPDAATARIGDTVTYEVTVRNVGAAAYTAANPAELVDDLTAVLDDAAYNNDATASSGPAPAWTAPQLTWSGPLAAGASVTLRYTVTLNSDGDQEVRNVAFQPDCDLADPACDPAPPATCVDGSDSSGRPCDTYVFEVPVLEITKAAPDLATARIGDVVEYTLTLANVGRGDFTAALPARLVDDLSDVLDDAVYQDDAAASAGPTPVHGADRITWSGPIAAGDSVTITYSVKLTLAGNTAVDNVAFEPGCTPGEAGCAPLTPDCVDGVGDGLACDEVRVDRPKLAISKTSPDLASASIGDVVQYVVTFSNVGRGDFDAATLAYGVDDLTAVLDDADYNGDASATSGTVVWDSPQLAWSGPLAAGGSVDLVYSVTLTGDGDRSVRNVAFESTCESGTAGCAPVPPTTCVDGVSDSGLACDEVVRDFGRLVSTKSVKAPKTVRDGSVLTYTVTIRNTGAADFTAAAPARVVDNMAGVLDDARYNRDATASSGKVRVRQPELTWTGPLAVGETVKVRYSFTVDTSKGGDGKLLNVVVSHDPFDPTGKVPTDGGNACEANPEDNAEKHCAVNLTVEEAEDPKPTPGPLPDTGSALPRGALLGGGLGGLLMLSLGALLTLRSRRQLA